ncbi:MAG: hypothetical protein NVSMB23_20990 [Myxococcales bacterium]
MALHLFSLTEPAARADAFLSRMEAGARDAFATAAQDRAAALGLRRGSEAIPLLLSPVSLPRDELALLGGAARLIASALVKVARDVIDRRPEKSRLLFAHLSPLELEALATRSREAEELLLARVDWFVDAGGVARALEVNATIPAMPVYSDAAVAGWLSAAAPAQAAALAARNPGNAAWLVDNLLAAARRAGRGARDEPWPRGLQVQLLHREGDPQLPELESLAALLRVRGAQARTATPADVVLDSDPARVLYRHLFARHVEPGSALGRAFLDPVRHGMWNRVDGWLETKGLFAELSAHADESGHLLEPDERVAIRAHVPFTRLLDDIGDGALGDGDRFVLKKSHDYGGKSVVIGRERGAQAFRAILAAARRDPPGTWVAQELVDAPSLARWYCAHSTDGRVFARRADLHLDVSTYATLLPDAPLGGSVCRAASGLVVNIAGGGGVAPLFADDVLQAALDAVERA